MTLTVAVDSTYQKLTGKTLFVQSLLASRIKEADVVVTFGASDTYTTGGVTVDLSLNGRITTILDVTPISNDKGVHVQYVPATASAAATGKVKLWGIDPAAGGGAVGAFSELASSSAVVNSMVLKLRVRGY